MHSVIPLNRLDALFASGGREDGGSHDRSRPIFLVGFQNQGNLGIGYLAATVRQGGYPARVFDFETDHEVILAAAKAERPLIVGFSLIFQFYIHRFASLI